MASVRSPGRSASAELSEQVARGNAVLRDLLVELALALLPRGVTPRTFSELSRQAFACAAATMSRSSNGKINQSRIAALTGLSRADVRRLLQNTDSAKPALRVTQMPVDRVLQGWRADRRFLDKHGNPKALRISGAPTSFSLLTRLYGGDVPHRAILDELQRMGAVRRYGKDVVLTRRERPPFTPLIFALPAIIDGIRIASVEQTSRMAPAIYRLMIPAKSELDLTVLRQRCVSTVATMLSGLGESLGGQLTRPSRNRVGSKSFVVTVLLTESKLQPPAQSRTAGKLTGARIVSNKVRRSLRVAKRI